MKVKRTGFPVTQVPPGKVWKAQDESEEEGTSNDSGARYGRPSMKVKRTGVPVTQVPCMEGLVSM